MEVVPDASGPGLVIGVADGGETRVVARGMADLDHGIPLASDTVFHVASVSKQFTAGLVVHLGIPFDDPVSRWLPWFPFPSIRVSHLVGHTSGLRDHWSLFELGGRRMEDVLTTADAMRTLATQRSLNFPPGSWEGYSNTNYTLLALLVSAAAGSPFADVAGEWLATLGLHDTRVVGSYRSVVPRRASSYSSAGRVALSYEVVGSTSLHTTAPDLLRWLSLDHFRATDPLPADLAGPETYGLGVRHSPSGTRYHAGADAGFRTYVARDPARDISVVVLANLGSIDVEAVAHRMLGVTPSISDGGEPPSGRFLDPRHGLLIDLHALRGGGLGFDGAHGPMRLAPAGPGRWAGPMASVVADGGVAVSDDPVRAPHRWRRLDPAGPPLTPGRYWCDEIEAHLLVTAGGEVALPGGAAHPASHAGEGWYAVPVPDREIGRLTLRVVSEDAFRCSVHGAQDLLYRRTG